MAGREQIIRSTFDDIPNVNRGNIFDWIQTNPYKVSDDRPAFIRSDGKTLSRKQLFQDVRRLAYALRHTLKISPGSRVAIFSPNSIMYPVMVCAAQCAGLVIVPLNPGYGAEEMVHPLKDAGVAYVFSHLAGLPVVHQALQLTGLSPMADAGLPRVWVLEDTDKISEGLNGEKDVRTLMGDKQLETQKVSEPATEDVFIAYSSGTSGKPKGVQLTHSNMTSVTAMMLTGLVDNFTPDDTHIGVLPFYHIFGLTKLIHHAVLVGIPVVVLPKFDLEAFCGAVQRFKTTIALLVPPIVLLLAKDPRVSKFDLSSLKFILSGAAPLGPELGDEVERRIPTLRVTQGYGLTETSPTATFTDYKIYREHKGAAGFTLPSIEIRLVDDEGKDVGHEQGTDGKPGELWIRGPTIMKGYLNNPAATEDCLTKDGWFKTGDVAIVKKNSIYIVDRKKELIKYKGFQVAPADLEALLLTHPKIVDVAVLGVYSKEQATELPRAYVVPAPGAADSGESKKAFADEVVAWTAKQVANHKKLRGGVIVTDVIPKSPSGKILRRVLRDQIEKEHAAGSTAQAKL